MLELGVMAPDFILPNQDNQTIRLHALRGRKVILFAFPKAKLSRLHRQACSFRDEFPQIQSASAHVFGISADSQEELAEWKESRQLPYDLLSDPNHTVLEAWGAWPTTAIFGVKLPLVARSYWVLDENGILVSQQVNVGPKESVEKALKAVTRSNFAQV